MQITIHRGSQEIGGTCIQLTSGATTLLLDAGQPLAEGGSLPDLAAIAPDAVLVSHPHQDHFGLIDRLSSATPVYLGQVARALIEAPRRFLCQDLPANTFRLLRPWQPVAIGDFTVTPLLVDHSSPEAFAFVIDSRSGKRVFYSGDFRAHGRKAVLLERLLRAPPAGIDVLFLEGTMLGRSNGRFPNEAAVEEKIFQVLHHQHTSSFIVTSSQNVDRLVSAYRACRRSGKRLVLDFYTAWVLEQVRKVAPGVPAMDWEGIRVYAHHRQDRVLKEHPDYFGDFRRRAYRCRVTREELDASPERYLHLSKMSRFRTLERYRRHGRVPLIYSQWLGYLDNPDERYFGAEAIAGCREDPSVDFVYAHTSGHAPLGDLQRLAAALDPACLVPVHTEHGDRFGEHFAKVFRLGDGQTLSI